MKKQICYFILPISLFSAFPINAEIITDGTLGASTNLPGPNFQINEELGSRVGANLFHSFSHFNIHSGESATFTGAADIANVISRVTGGSVSTINGVLQSQVGTADFYFINPAGIIFGQNAQINVPAAFHASTADVLNFADGSQFNAVDPNNSSLTIATPSSFGFTQRQSAKIVMDGSTLTAQTGKHLSFTAAELEADSAQIYAQSGTISLLAVGNKDNQVDLHTPILEQQQLNATGRLELNSTHINVNGDGGGQINLAAGETQLIVTDLFNTNTGVDTKQTVLESNIKVQSLYMDNSWVKNDSAGPGTAPSIHLQVENDLAIINGSVFSNSTFAQGDSGILFVSAKNILIDRKNSEFVTGIVSNVNQQSNGHAGTVELQVLEHLEIINQGEVSSNTFGAGNAGKVVIHADSLYIDGRNLSGLTGISSQAISGSTGHAGSIDINVEHSIDIFDAGIISSETYSQGDAGSISIHSDTFYINRFNSDYVTGVFSNASTNSTGNSGDISIQTDNWLSIVDGGKISSSTFALGDAGSIDIQTKQLFLDGNSSIYNTGIISNAEGESSGDAGELNVRVSELTEIYAGATIASNTFSSGDAGTVLLSSGDILIDDLGANELTGIVSQTNSSGQAGELTILVSGDFVLQNGGEVSTNTFGQGNAGTINIKTGSLSIDRQDSEIVTGIISNSIGSGHAGSVNIVVEKNAEIINGGQVASSSFAQGDAGEVNVNTHSLLIDGKNASEITGIISNSQEDSEGDAGTITVSSETFIKLLSGGKIVSNTESSGAAGSISIHAGELYLDRQGSPFFTGISSNAEFGSNGDAGQVFVDVSGLTSILNAAEIGSNTFAIGDAGEVTINTQALFIDAGDSNAITGIFSDAVEGSQGDAGIINVYVTADSVLQHGGKIASNTYSQGNAGDINFSAKNLSIDGQDYPFNTGINSVALSGSSGNAGAININVSETLSITDGGEIATNTEALGNAGVITINAKNINIDRENNSRFTGIFSDAIAGSSGHAGSLKITITDHLNIIDGAWLSSNTSSIGDAGDIELISGDITLDANDSGVFTGVFSNAFEESTGNAGSIDIKNSGLISILNGASIATNTFSEGNGGTISLLTNNLLLNHGDAPARTGVFSIAAPTSSGNSGSLNISSLNHLEIISGASISSTTFGLGDAGSIFLHAGDINIEGKGTSSTSISSNSESIDKGHAGSIDIHVDNTLSILDGGSIGSSTFSKGDAGEIHIISKNLMIDALTSSFFTGIASQAGRSSGNAGFLNIQATNQIDLLNGGKITTTTFALGNAGDIQVATKNLNIDSQFNPEILTGIFSNTRSTGAGNAGSIDIQADGYTHILNGGEISSNTYSQGDAGFISLVSNSLLIDRGGDSHSTGIFSLAKSNSSGNAGFLKINSQAQVELINGGEISTDTFAVGNAGDIELNAGQLFIDGQGNQTAFTGIFSNTQSTHNGHAGSIKIGVDDSLQILRGAQISSNTYSAGDAGQIQVNAASIFLDVSTSLQNTGFFSDAIRGSSGNAGTISLTTSGLIEIINGARVSSNTEQSGNAGDIQITSGSILLDANDSGFITGIVSNAKAGSSGQAGNIEIQNSGDINLLSGGTITSLTEAQGDAGSINIKTHNLFTDAQNSSQLTGVLSDAREGSFGSAGQIDIFVHNDLNIYRGSQISSDTIGLGNAGNVKVESKNITIDRQDDFATGIFSNTYSAGQGNAGSIQVTASGDINIINGGEISSNTYSQGYAGVIQVNAKNLNMDRQGANIFTGIFSDAKTDSGGNAGSIRVTVEEQLNILNGAWISSNTDAIGNAGDILVNTSSLTLNGQASGIITGILSNANETSSGDAGKIEVNTSALLKILDGAEISSSTAASGNAGEILINAAQLRVDNQNSNFLTGIFSNAEANSQGDAGQLKLNISGDMQILHSGKVSTNTEGAGNAGDIEVLTNSLSINQDNGFATGIFSDSRDTAQGNAGSISVQVAKQLEIVNGGEISSNTFTPGNAGFILVDAENILLDRQAANSFTGIFSDAKADSTGNAGTIEIHAHELLQILNGAWVSSNTESIGDAGDIQVNSASAILNAQGSGIVTGIFSNAKQSSTGAAGKIKVTIPQSLNIFAGAEISSNTAGQGNAGEIIVDAGELQVDNKGFDFITGIFSNAEADSHGNAGQLSLNITGKMQLLSSGKISTNTEGSGHAGDIKVNTHSLMIDRQDGFSTGIFSDSRSTANGNAGSISVQVEQQLEIFSGGEISSNTFSKGHAGIIQVNAENILLDRQGAGAFNGIFSDAKSDSGGNAGTIKITSAGLIEILDGAWISSNTDGLGNAGDIEIISGGIKLDAKNNGILTGILSNANPSSEGHAGSIKITNSELIEIYRGAQISSNTDSIGDAGSIQIDSQNILLNSQNSEFLTGITTNAGDGSQGDAGKIAIVVEDTLNILDGTEIGSNTRGAGNAGNIQVQAGNLLIDSQASKYFTGIGSDTLGDGSGHAGTINVSVGKLLKLSKDASISSVSDTAGNAGEIFIQTQDLMIDAENSPFRSITSESRFNSSGEVGNIDIMAQNIELHNGAQISINAAGQIQSNIASEQHYIHLYADQIKLVNGATITAESLNSSPAASIVIDTTGNFELSNLSSVSTAAKISDGGPISIHSGLMSLENSLITTSVSGTQGNGGNISITTPALIMQTGFIQGNTAASGASGGDILIDTPQLIFPGNQVFLTNQDERISFVANTPQNVIQAAAPDGVSGNVTVTAPTLDISSSILNISTRFSDQSKISKNPCKVSAGEIPSSLTWVGQGGLPATHSDSINLPMGTRLKPAADDGLLPPPPPSQPKQKSYRDKQQSHYPGDNNNLNMPPSAQHIADSDLHRLGCS